MTRRSERIFLGPLVQLSFRHVVMLDSSVLQGLMGHQIMTLRMGKAGALFLWVRNNHLLRRCCIPHRHLCVSRHSSSAKPLSKRALGPSMPSVVTRVYLWPLPMLPTD
jgi:hypothetical protein